MADCLSNEAYRALESNGPPLDTAAVQAYYDQPLCNAITIKCANVTTDSLLAIVQCERDIKLGIEVLPPCVARTHPSIVRALEQQCPDRAKALNTLRTQLGIRKASVLSTGSVFAMFAAAAAAGVALGMMTTRPARRRA